ncbi:Cd(II)/Pb(II)-responsive transcriptional regulator [Bordetella sp. FB-8]|uniref:Cd(II)/Pb(II)-responsive transcriptional regulator n=1 Tax=Bordetella sp. FB-8 TaxID=1159870 RepID=UPI00035C8021|nr:Cd(II)/Pb(II)-responsive transcriptional regulator [Bordetella sp. FB-8]
MKISEIAQAAKTTPETIRFYEKTGLLPPAARTDGNYRHYGSTHMERLRFIRNCRALDMTHDEIRALLAMMDDPPEGCGAVNDLLDEHLGHVDARIAELLHLRDQLHALRGQCQTERAMDDCGILRGLTAMEPEMPGQRHTHLG